MYIQEQNKNSISIYVLSWTLELIHPWRPISNNYMTYDGPISTIHLAIQEAVIRSLKLEPVTWCCGFPTMYVKPGRQPLPTVCFLTRHLPAQLHCCALISHRFVQIAYDMIFKASHGIKNCYKLALKFIIRA